MKQKFASKLWKRALSTGLSLAMAFTMVPTVGVMAAPGDESPVLKAGSIQAADDQTTNNQPFTSKTGSEKFASPAYAVRKVEKVMSNNQQVRPTTGMTSDLMIAAAEARYDTTGEGGGQDIMVSVSSDKGKTWKYSYPFNFPDSTASGNTEATTVSNPVLVESTTKNDNGAVNGGTIYCLANVYPGGVAPVNGFTYPGVGTGYVEIDGTKYLALADTYDKAAKNPTANDADYAYYIGAFEENGYAPVNDKTSKAAATIDGKQYYVDKWYNLYTKNGDAYTAELQTSGQLDAAADAADQLQQNVFYKNSKLHVYNTGYIMCVTSADGETWSEPEILNPQVYRDETEMVFLVSGSGLKTTANRIVVPVYSKKDAEARDDKASIIWKYDSCEHSEAGTPWAHRSDDVPELPAGEEGDPTWMQGGELVEMSRGQLRMFIRHGRSNIIYADAGRGITSEEGGAEANANTDMFTFSDPVMTGTSVTPDAKVSAIEYSQIVNPGTDDARVILTAMPTGAGRTNGRLAIFGSSDANNKINPPISRIHDHSLTNGNFASASMDESNYGSNIGVLWENGRGSVRFENYYMLDLLQDAGNNQRNLYVADLEYDLELRPNGTAYTSSYSVTGDGNMEPAGRDFASESNSSFDIAFNRGEDTRKDIPALYSRTVELGGNDSGTIKLSACFAANADTSLDFANAEFTLLKPSNADAMSNVYTVYSERAQRYLININKDTFFGTTNRSNVKISYNTEDRLGINDGFLFQQYNAEGNGRYAIFDRSSNNFNAMSSQGNAGANWSTSSGGRYDYHLQLLRKLTSAELEEVDEADVINFGPADSDDYKFIKLTADDQIMPGRKYVIAYEALEAAKGDPFTEGGYVILYPRNSMINYGKLAYGTRQAQVAATKTLTITPKAKTAAPIDLKVNNTTYHISVKNESIMIPKGGSTFIAQTELDDVDLGSTNLVQKLEATETRKALYDCLGAPSDSGKLDGYATEPNWEANVANAEWVITETGNQTTEGEKLYNIYNEWQGNYLVNQNATNYFSANPVPQVLTKQESKDAFEVRRYDPDNSNPRMRTRYMYFYYPRMAFDGLEEKTDTWLQSGDYGFEILKKKSGNVESNEDPIPGYELVTGEIESGESYLIVKYCTETLDGGKTRDAILVLYPRTGITNQSKMFAETEVPGVRLTANENANIGDKAEITVNGTTYDVEIEGECDHDYTQTIVSVPATCKRDGSTGDLVCSHCRQVLRKGEVIPKLNHTWTDNWTVTTEPTINRTAKTVTDGSRTRTCSGGEETETEVISGEAYLQTIIGQTIANARTEAAKTNEYAAETIKALNDAITAATAAVSGQTPADVAGKIDALVGLESALDPDNMVSQDAYNSRKDALDDLLTEAESKVTQTDVYTEASLGDLQSVLDGIGDNLSYVEMQDAIDDLTEAIGNLKTLDEEACEEMLPTLKDTLESMEAVAAAGQKNYTDETWKKFIDAYNKLHGKTDAELIAMGADELGQLLAGLNTKLEEKKITPPPAANKLQVNTDHTIGGAVYTVTDAVKNETVLKKGADTKKFTVPPTVSINGVTCKVVGIGDGAFSGCKKLKNVIIGENVTSIGAKAFFKCTKLSKVTINGAKAPAIKKAAFKKTASKVTVKAKKLNKKQKKAFLKILKKTGKISKKSVVK